MSSATAGCPPGGPPGARQPGPRGKRPPPAGVRAMHGGGWHLAASPLASPFRPGPDGSREEVVAKYREYLLGRQDLLAMLPGLRGRRLGCWCAPLPCHAMVIAELADA